MNARSIQRRRARRNGRGIPGWVVTFGDMMALLLCFFILLQMFSEFKRDHEYQRVVTAIKEAFEACVGVLPTDDIPARSMVEILETMSVANGAESKMSRSADEGIVGEHTRVSRVAEGVQFTVGGVHLFEPHSVEVTESGRLELRQLATLLAGRRNVVLIRGHAAAIPARAFGLVGSRRAELPRPVRPSGAARGGAGRPSVPARGRRTPRAARGASHDGPGTCGESPR